MRKIILVTKDELKDEYYQKYLIKDCYFSSSTLEKYMNIGRLLILNIDNLNFDRAKEILSLIYKYRYSVYSFKECIGHHFLRYINKNEITFINNIEDVEENCDFSKYRNIYHIGDVHGCYLTLIKFWNNYYNEDDLFIFLGDLIDRGEHSIEVLKFCLEKKDLPNVIFLEGNHDSSLWYYSQSNYPKMQRSFTETFEELTHSDISKYDLEKFMLKTKECISYRYYEKNVLLSHGGLLSFPKRLFVLDSSNYINGQGNDYTQVDKIFMDRTDWVYYQIHGHRNIYGYNSDKYIGSQNLEGGIEYGGSLRVSILNRRGFSFLYFKNCQSHIKNYIKRSS